MNGQVIIAAPGLNLSLLACDPTGPPTAEGPHGFASSFPERHASAGVIIRRNDAAPWCLRVWGVWGEIGLVILRCLHDHLTVKKTRDATGTGANSGRDKEINVTSGTRTISAPVAATAPPRPRNPPAPWPRVALVKMHRYRS